MPAKKIKQRLAYILFTSLVMFFGFPSLAFAYIDPATTSYIIQIVSGLIISLSVAFGVFFRRIQMGFVTAMARLQAFWMRMTSKRHRQLRKIKKQRQKNQPKPKKEPVPIRQYLFAEQRLLKSRLLMAVLVAGAIAFTLILFGFTDLFAANREVMPYPLVMIILPIIVCFLVVAVVLAAVLGALRGRVFNCGITLVVGILLVIYIQGNFLNGGLGQLTGDYIDWAAYTPDIIFNSIVCLLIIAIPFLFLRLSKKAWRGFVLFVPALLIGMQLIGLISVLTTSGALNDKPVDRMYLSDVGLYEVSPNHNTIVFLLDRLDQRYVNELIAEEPDFFTGKLNGFTRYTNNIASTSRTYPSVVNMLTGLNYSFDYPASEFMHNSWRNGTFLPKLRESGYVSKIYTDASYAYLDGSDLVDAADNVELESPRLDSLGALNKLAVLSAYRYLPLGLKQFYWLSTEYFQEDIQYYGPEGQRYIVNDHAIYKGVTQQGISVSSDSRDNFIFYHFNGSHPPYDVDMDFNKVAYGNSSSYLQTRFAFTIVLEYIDQLKTMGLYDDATIIITGDHGYTVNLGWQGDFEDLTEPEVTGLFVKLSGEAEAPLSTSTAPVCSDNLRTTVYQQAGLEYQSMGDGLTYNQVPLDSTHSRRFMFRVNGYGSQDSHLQFFDVTGDANRFSNWKEVDRKTILYWYG